MKYVKVEPSKKPFPGAPPKQPIKKIEVEYINRGVNMNGFMMVTKENRKLDIYNQVSTIEDYKKKLTEEYSEVMKENNVELLAGEVMDVMQICINMLDKLQEDFGVKDPVKKHYHKLIKRGWKAEKRIYFAMVEGSDNA